MNLKDYNLEPKVYDYLKGKVIYNPETGRWDSDGEIYLSSLNLTSIPIPFGEVKGQFSIKSNKITSLKNSPIKAYAIYCDFNEISDLNYLSENINNLTISNNNLTSLKGCPKNMNILNLKNNELTSLEYGPTYVNKISIYGNYIKELDIIMYKENISWSHYNDWVYFFLEKLAHEDGGLFLNLREIKEEIGREYAIAMVYKLFPDLKYRGKELNINEQVLNKYYNLYFKQEENKKEKVMKKHIITSYKLFTEEFLGLGNKKKQKKSFDKTEFEKEFLEIVDNSESEFKKLFEELLDKYNMTIQTCNVNTGSGDNKTHKINEKSDNSETEARNMLIPFVYEKLKEKDNNYISFSIDVPDKSKPGIDYRLYNVFIKQD